LQHKPPRLDLHVEYCRVDELKPHSRNARIHSKHQIRQIAESIKAFGFTNPILIDRASRIVAGHGRARAAELLGMERVPTIQLENLNEDQIRAYVLADNRLAEKAGWDQNILAIELQHLLTIDSDFDVTITGFEVPEIDLILEESNSKPDTDDIFAVPDTGPPVTQSNDLWMLGKHRILCSNSMAKASYDVLMVRQRADVVFSDPPYNVAIDGNVSGKGAVHHREFAMASGELTEAEFIAFLARTLGHLVRYSRNRSVHFICMDWRHIGELCTAGRQIYDELLNVCVWVKDNAGMGSFYRSRYELVFVFRNGKSPHRNNIQLGRFGRNRTNVWEYPGANTFSKQAEEGNLLALHPTVKPVALIADALLDCSARGQVVLDPFLGSGSTLIAAERVGRLCYGIEIDPLYVDVAIHRWQKYTGDRAIHALTGKSFDEVAGTSEAQGG
jgi:DNA modification methylase